MPLGDLWSVSTALELACHGQLAIFSHQNERGRAIVEMQLGPLFARVMGKVSVAGVLAAHRQWLKRLEPGPCQNLMTTNMGHPCRHAIFRLHRPFTLQDFDQHWWFVQPSTRRADTETVIYDVFDCDTVLKELLEGYVNDDRHQQRMLYDHAIAAPDFEIRDPVLVRTRGRPTGSTCRSLSHFEHVENALNPKRC